MELKKITDRLSVGPQIGVADLAALKAQGFRTIICNRPDHEAADQQTFAEIAAAAGPMGFELRHIPVRSGEVTPADIGAFGAAVRDLPGPVLAYCRSGARSAGLWSMAEAASR